AFELHKAAAGFTRFAFRYERAFLAAERVHVHVGAVAAIAHRAGMGHALAMNAEREMQGDDFALAPITFAAMTRTTLLLPCGDLVRGWLFRRCRGAAGRAIGAMLALASLSTS